jgi:hypothetical protein
LIEKLATDGKCAHYYGYLLGEQTPFKHSTHVDRFIYESTRNRLERHFRHESNWPALDRQFSKMSDDIAMGPQAKKVAEVVPFALL